ncbi:MAG: hypothetical protein ABR926_19420 [Streptosporangiaceae bacterium]
MRPDGHLDVALMVTLIPRSPWQLAGPTGKLAHLVVTAADLPYGAAIALTEDSVLRALRSKILGPLFAAQLAAPRMVPPGSITFT